MNGNRRCSLAAIALGWILAAATTPAGAGELPGDSYYQLDVVFETHTGRTLRFAELQGSTLILAMVYASCPHVCPLTISTIQSIENQLTPEERGRVRVLLVTLDPERDSVPALAGLAERHRISGDRWFFAKTSPEDVRLLAAALGVQYRVLPDGSVDHSSPIILLDSRGREIDRSETGSWSDVALIAPVAAAHARN